MRRCSSAKSKPGRRIFDIADNDRTTGRPHTGGPYIPTRRTDEEPSVAEVLFGQWDCALFASLPFDSHMSAGPERDIGAADRHEL
jgi:hypothetical protein